MLKVQAIESLVHDHKAAHSRIPTRISQPVKIFPSPSVEVGELLELDHRPGSVLGNSSSRIRGRKQMGRVEGGTGQGDKAAENGRSPQVPGHGARQELP